MQTVSPELFDKYFLSAMQCTTSEQKYFKDRAEWALNLTLSMLETRHRYLNPIPVDYKDTDDVCRERITRTRGRL